MGTYVYPLAKTTTIRERLAGVSAGTADLYALFGAKWTPSARPLAFRDALSLVREHGAARSHEERAQLADALDERPAFRAYDRFLAYDIGEIGTANAVAVRASEPEDVVVQNSDGKVAIKGRTSDRDHVTAILECLDYELPDVRIADVGVLYWT